jgi:hypothetical protein
MDNGYGFLGYRSSISRRARSISAISPGVNFPIFFSQVFFFLSKLIWVSGDEILTRQPAQSFWQRVQDVFFNLFPKKYF